MQHLEVSGAVQRIYIYIYIYVIRRLKVNVVNEGKWGGGSTLGHKCIKMSFLRQDIKVANCEPPPPNLESDGFCTISLN